MTAARFATCTIGTLRGWRPASDGAAPIHQLPDLLSVQQHARWWLVGLSGWATAAWTWRDPAR